MNTNDALIHELGRAGVPAEQQKTLEVHYDGVVVGHYAADLVVDSKIIVELKAAKETTSIHEAQLINYLRTTGIRIGLVLNFGTPRLGIRRLVF